MTRNQARAKTEELLRHSRYLYRKTLLDGNTIHLTFQMDSRTHDLQMTLRFEETYCDILCFISPTVLRGDSTAALETLKLVNEINWYVKAWGRYYIDDNWDIAYSLRLGYHVLEAMPDACLDQIETAVAYYADLFVLLLKVSEGKETYETCKQFIEEMWGAEQ